jgi:hypothetical protein
MHFALRRTATILMLALAAPTAGALAPAAFDLSVETRFELLGVVRQLAGHGRADAGSAEYRERVEKRFGAFRGHPAVALYADLASSPSREEAAATILLYYTNPPELALKDRNADIHYVGGPGEAEEMQRFLQELRDFARASGFMSFCRDNSGFYGRLEESARESLGAVDPISVIERYLGVGLSSRSHYILLPRPDVTHAFIVPYPLPPANAGTGSFDVYTMSPDLRAGGFPNVVWPEPLFVFIDPSFYYFEKLNIPVPADFYGAEVASCRAVSPDCVKSFAVSALVEHLNRAAKVPPVPGESRGGASALEVRRIKALSARLDEYDAHRDRYPTLWDFYPRWFSVFEEEAFPGRAPRALAVPAAPKIRKAADFFEPAVIEVLLRTGAR